MLFRIIESECVRVCGFKLGRFWQKAAGWFEIMQCACAEASPSLHVLNYIPNDIIVIRIIMNKGVVSYYLLSLFGNNIIMEIRMLTKCWYRVRKLHKCVLSSEDIKKCVGDGSVVSGCVRTVWSCGSQLRPAPASGWRPFSVGRTVTHTGVTPKRCSVWYTTLSRLQGIKILF